MQKLKHSDGLQGFKGLLYSILVMWAIASHSCCILSFASVHYTKHNGLARHWQSSGDSRGMIAGESDRKWSLTCIQNCKGLELIWTGSERSVNKQELLQMAALIRFLLEGVLSHSHVGNPIHLCHGEKREGLIRRYRKARRIPLCQFRSPRALGHWRGAFYGEQAVCLGGCKSSRRHHGPKSSNWEQRHSSSPLVHQSMCLWLWALTMCVPWCFFLMLAGDESSSSHLPYLIISYCTHYTLI